MILWPSNWWTVMYTTHLTWVMVRLRCAINHVCIWMIIAGIRSAYVVPDPKPIRSPWTIHSRLSLSLAAACIWSWPASCILAVYSRICTPNCRPPSRRDRVSRAALRPWISAIRRHHWSMMPSYPVHWWSPAAKGPPNAARMPVPIVASVSSNGTPMSASVTWPPTQDQHAMMVCESQPYLIFYNQMSYKTIYFILQWGYLVYLSICALE